MASDTFVGPKIEFEPGGDTMDVKSGGVIAIASGGSITGTRIERKMVSVGLTSATALTAGYATKTVYSTELPSTVKKISLVLNSALAGHATSNATLTVNKLSALATATTAVASKTFTTSNAVTAYVPTDITLTSSVSIGAGETLVQTYTFASSGQDVSIGQLVVEYSIDAA